MDRKLNFSINEFYHIYNRGNNKSVIFLDDKDRKRFQKLMYLCNNTEPVVFKDFQGIPISEIPKKGTIVDIGTYCLMPNHFHILLHEKIEGGVSRFLEKLSTAYSMYFNKKYDRTGKLFEGRFKATHLNNDNYLKYIFSYIHLNPIKIIDPKWKEDGIKNKNDSKKYLTSYTYSSYLDYMGTKREEELILNRSVFPEYFGDFKEFEQFIDEWLDFSKE